MPLSWLGSIGMHAISKFELINNDHVPNHVLLFKIKIQFRVCFMVRSIGIGFFIFYRDFRENSCLLIVK